MTKSRARTTFNSPNHSDCLRTGHLTKWDEWERFLGNDVFHSAGLEPGRVQEREENLSENIAISEGIKFKRERIEPLTPVV